MIRVALIVGLMASPAIAADPGEWIDRCLAEWNPTPINEVDRDWVNPSSCMFVQISNCRFVEEADQCVAQAEQHATSLLERSTSRLPAKLDEDGFTAKSINRTLEYIRALERQHSFAEYSKDTYWTDFQWLGAERQNRVFGLMLRLGGVLPLQKRIERYNAE